MTSTATTIRVPIRTWQEKAIAAATIGGPLLGVHEDASRDSQIAFVDEHLVDPAATDALIDGYFEDIGQLVRAQALLAQLRDLTPGSDAVLAVPGEFGFVERLNDEIIAYLGDLQRGTSKLTRKQLTEAMLAAMNLHDELAGGDS